MSKKQAAQSGESKAGRPKGSETKDRDVNTVEPSPCKNCGSIRRNPYKRVIRHKVGGTRKVFGPDGGIIEVAYQVVVFRYTYCADCGRPRIDKSFE